MAQTTIPSISADGFAQRIGQAPAFPRGWANDQARQQGGVFYALMNTLGSQLSFLVSELQYALNAQRIQTETSPELDIASVDFFGQGVLPRPSGMSNAAFLQLIKDNLLQRAATRTAVSNAILRLTGVTPRIVEPWNPGDTGCMDAAGYIDIDTPGNPMEPAAPGDRYQGFITSVLPPITGLGNNPLLTIDDGGFMDTNEFNDTAAGAVLGLQALYNVINKFRTYGTIAWVRTVPSLP